MYVRDLLSCEVFARGGGTHTLQQGTTLKADTMRAADKMDSCSIRAALQILETSVRAPQNMQTVAEVHSLAAAHADERSHQRSWRCERPGVSCWRPNRYPVVSAMLT